MYGNVDTENRTDDVSDSPGGRLPTAENLSVMIETLRSLLRDVETVVCECRQCGRNVDLNTDRCPDCGSERIASYSVE